MGWPVPARRLGIVGAVLILAGLLTQSIQYWVVIFNVRSADMLYRPEPEERRRVRYRLRSAPMQVAQQFLAALARDWDSPARRAEGPPGPVRSRARRAPLAETRGHHD